MQLAEAEGLLGKYVAVWERDASNKWFIRDIGRVAEVARSAGNNYATVSLQGTGTPLRRHYIDKHIKVKVLDVSRD